MRIKVWMVFREHQLIESEWNSLAICPISRNFLKVSFNLKVISFLKFLSILFLKFLLCCISCLDIFHCRMGSHEAFSLLWEFTDRARGGSML